MDFGRNDEVLQKSTQRKQHFTVVGVYGRQPALSGRSDDPVLWFDDPHRPGLGIMTTRRKGRQIEDIHFLLCKACYLSLLPIPSRQAIPVHPPQEFINSDSQAGKLLAPDNVRNSFDLLSFSHNLHERLICQQPNAAAHREPDLLAIWWSRLLTIISISWVWQISHFSSFVHLLQNSCRQQFQATEDV